MGGGGGNKAWWSGPPASNPSYAHCRGRGEFCGVRAYRRKDEGDRWTDVGKKRKPP